MPRENLRLEGIGWSCWQGRPKRKHPREKYLVMPKAWRRAVDELAADLGETRHEVVRRLVYAGMQQRFQERGPCGPWGGILRPREVAELIAAGYRLWRADDQHHRRRLAELTEPTWICWAARSVGTLDAAMPLPQQLVARRRAEKAFAYHGRGLDDWLGAERDGWFRWLGAKAALAFQFWGQGMPEARLLLWLAADGTKALEALHREWTPTPPPGRPLTPPVPASRAQAQEPDPNAFGA